jgi:hypothetical protein
VVEWIAILFQIYLTALFQQYKYLYICLFALFNLYMINIFNYCYVRNNVLSKTATKKDRLNQKQLKAIQTQYKKKLARGKAYKKAMELEEKKALQKRAKEQKALEFLENEGGEASLGYLDEYPVDIYDSDEYEQHYESDASYSDNAVDEDDLDLDAYEGGKFEIDQETLDANGLLRDGDSYYQIKNIHDSGFNKWVGAYDRTAKYLKWLSLLTTFKLYRMTYSFCMGRKQFLVLYQKKKFKKITVMQTLLS